MKASHFIQPWQPRKLVQWKQNLKHCNYMTQSIDPISMYQICALALNIILSVLVISHIRMLDRHCVGPHTPTAVAANALGSCHIYNILKLFVPLSQRNESDNVMNQLFKLCMWCRNSSTNDRKFARSGMLWHSLVFQLMELLYSFQNINKWNACSDII
jgi:hypothetical protein